MGNKKIVIILGILFVITFLLGLIGFFNKDIDTSIKPTPINTNIKTISYNNDVMEIPSLDDKISSFEFIKANKEFNSGYIKVYIDNGIVKIDIQKSGLINQEQSSDVITYEIKDVSSPKAVQAQMSNTDSNRVNIYILDSFNRLFLSTFNASDFISIDTYYINIPNIVSFTTLTIPLITNNEQIYSIIKTTDGSYYTDYKFEESDEIKITKINNKVEEVNQ